MTKITEDDYIFIFPQHIQKRIDAGKGCDSGIGKGWLQIVINVDKQLSAINPDYRIDQIKEKFGGLRFYFSGISYDEVSEIIENAEQLSVHTCDICGEKGELRYGDWRVTRCDKHAHTKDGLAYQEELRSEW